MPWLLIGLFSLLLASCGRSSGETTERRQAASNQASQNSNEAAGNSSGDRSQTRTCQPEVNGGELINLVVIVGNRANTSEIPAGSVVDDLFCEMVGQTFEISGLEAQGNIAFVISDGNPSRVEMLGQNNRPADLSVSANNSYMLNNRIENTISNTILPFMDSIHLRAQNPEADLFEALHVASRVLRDMNPERENHILIIDSGITTTGHLDMREFNILEPGISSEIIFRLNEASLLPDLHDVNVSLFNIGGVSAPQSILSGPIEGALMTFWQHIIQSSGANILHLQGRSEGGNPRLVQDGYPFVSIVEFETPVLDLSDLRSEIFSAQSLGFLGDQSEFIDDATARAVLSTTAESLIPFLESNPSHTIYVVGSQAAGMGNSTAEYQLSLERAQRVRDLLVLEFDLPSERLVAIGAGTTVLSWRNTEEFVDGVWDNSLAERNRVVAIIPSTAEEVWELRGQGLVD